MENRFGTPASGTPEWSARREFELLLLLGGSRKAAVQLWLRKQRIYANAQQAAGRPATEAKGPREMHWLRPSILLCLFSGARPHCTTISLDFGRWAFALLESASVVRPHTVCVPRFCAGLDESFRTRCTLRQWGT